MKGTDRTGSDRLLFGDDADAASHRKLLKTAKLASEDDLLVQHCPDAGGVGCRAWEVEIDARAAALYRLWGGQTQQAEEPFAASAQQKRLTEKSVSRFSKSGKVA